MGLMRVLNRAVPKGLLSLGMLAGALMCCSAPALAESAVDCPNAALRTGPSESLPDCRAYELVNPGTREIGPIGGTDYAFPDGQHVLSNSFLPLAGSRNGTQEGEQYLSTRGPNGWSMASLSTPQGPSGPAALTFEGGLSTAIVSFTSDFSAAFVDSPFDSDPLDQDRAMDVYRVEPSSGSSALASLPDTGPMVQSFAGGAIGGLLPGAYLAGSSADGSHVVFETNGQLPVAPGTTVDTHTSEEEVYDRTGGHTYLVGVLPDGSVPACGAEVGQGPHASDNAGSEINAHLSYGAVSPDGSNIVFQSYGNGNQSGCIGPYDEPNTATLYLREDNAKTVQLPGDFFAGRTADGSKIFTLGEAPNDVEGPIYEYDIATGQTTRFGDEAELAGYPSDKIGVELLGYSADGSHVYFQRAGNIFLWDNGTTIHIPGTGVRYGEGVPGDGPGGYPASGAIHSSESTATSVINDMPAVTPDGSKMVFVDFANITGYNSNRHSEVYLYDADTNSVTCVSCNPSVPAGQSEADIQLAWLHPEDPLAPPSVPVVSDDGSRVFFETGEALVPQDTNGLEDVYEWDDGRVSLLSSGQGSLDSFLVGVGDDGDDVFIRTGDRLLPQVEDGVEHVYDARVDGGFPYTPSVYGCESGQCQGQPGAPPAFAAPGSSVFSGAGNAAPPVPVAGAPKGKPKKKVVKCAKGKTLSHGKCVKAKGKKKTSASKAAHHKGGK
jgi:hypothetical protein